MHFKINVEYGISGDISAHVDTTDKWYPKYTLAGKGWLISFLEMIGRGIRQAMLESFYLYF